MKARNGLRWMPALLAALALFGLTATPGVAQQTGRVQGTVVNGATQQALSGAQVFVDGTNIGSLTNSEGSYLLLNVPAGTHTVRVQMIGYGGGEQQVVVAAGELATADFELSQTAVALEQVVVTGTATEVRRREIGNSLEAITSSQIETAPVENAQEALAARAPGVTYMRNSGQPGAGGTIKIRGITTVSQNMEPLIYVDGVRIFHESTRAGWGGRTSVNPLQDIAAEDIARVEVVKGAAATTLYGTEASAGVVQIFTKEGIAGEPLWNAEISTGFNQMGHWGSPDDPTNLFVTCGKNDLLYGMVVDTEDDNFGGRQYWEDPTCPSDGDWTDPGVIQNYALSVRGGGESLTYYLSGSYGDQRGVLPTQGAKSGTVRGNFTFSPADNLSLSLNTAFTRRDMGWVGDGNNAEGFLLNVGRGYRGYLQGGKEGESDCVNVPDDKECVTNRYVFDQQLNTRVDHFISGLTLNYNPTDQLTNRFVVGWDYNDQSSETTILLGFPGIEGGYYWDEPTRHTKLSLDYAGSFQNNFGESLASTFSWGGQIFRDNHRWTEIDVEDFAGPGEPTLESGANISYLADQRLVETSAGFFLQELLGWQDRLFLTAGLRVDGHSAFGDDFGLQFYPKLSLAYVLSDYDFWPTAWWETFKLRGAIGESGKAPGAFDQLRTWTAVAGDEGQPGVSPSNLGNAELGPERTREIEMGFDASLFAGRLGLEATAYQATTREALVGVTYPPSEGFTETRMENVGELRNRGLEFQLTGDLVRTAALTWSARANMSFRESEALDLDGGDPATTSIYTGLNSEIREGYTVPSYFGNLITNPDEFEDPVIVSDTALGPVYPTRTIGVGTTFQVGNNLTVDALAEYQGGHYVQNYTAYQNARRGVWYPCYDVQEKMFDAIGPDREWDTGDDNPNALADVTALERGRCSFTDYDNFYWVEKADFTKLRSVSVTYNLPPEWVRFGRSASVSLAGRNLWTWTDYSGSDPEVQDVADQFDLVGSDGQFGRRDYYQLPPPRTFILTFRVGF